jgi:hypothetical protein
MKLVLREKYKTDEELQSAPTGPKVGDAGGSSYQSPSFRMEANLQDAGSAKKGPHIAMLDECGCGCDSCMGGEHHEEDEVDDNEELTQRVIAGLYDDPEAIYIVIGEEDLTEEKKKGDRCIRIAKRKYHKWPSAYASGAVVKCRQGKIWKGLKENANIVEYEVLSLTLQEAVSLLEKYKPNFSLEKSQGLHGWFKRNKGKGWIDCKTGKPCGREKAGRGAKRKYPACRPTKAQCNKSGTRRKRTGASVSWKPKKDK